MGVVRDQPCNVTAIIKRTRKCCSVNIIHDPPVPLDEGIHTNMISTYKMLSVLWPQRGPWIFVRLGFDIWSDTLAAKQWRTRDLSRML